jgi:hypothetical protein
MRNLLVVLILANVIYAIWNVISYSHIGKMQQIELLSFSEMPGTQLQLGGSNGINTSNSSNINRNRTTDHVCVLIGPESDLSLVENLNKRYESIGVTTRIVTKETDMDVDYWVYLNPEPTREAALRRLKELHSKKIDSFIIPEGELRNGVSVGIFDKEFNAEKRKAELVAYGYSVNVRAEKKIHIEYWIIIQAIDAEIANKSVLDHADGGKELKSRVIECNKLEGDKL